MQECLINITDTCYTETLFGWCGILQFSP